MRNIFAKEIVKLAEQDKDIILLVGDIGFRIFDEFIDKFPKRFINCGIAEQNMISVAAGMASEGKKPIVYTIVPFLVMRAFEQIRVDIGINNQNVILVGVGGGLAYDKLGATHHSCEDIALMRLIANMSVYVPFDPEDTKSCLKQSYELSKKGFPSYLRLSKGGEPILPRIFNVYKNITCIKKGAGNNVVIISHGSITAKIQEYVLKNELDQISIITISCLTNETIDNLTKHILENKELEKIIVVEEHFRIGGLYEALTSRLIESKIKLKILNINVEHKYIFEIENHQILLEKNGIYFNKIKDFIKS